MAAEGTTHIEGISHIDRGYERLDQKLGLLGASIQRLPCLPSELTLWHTNWRFCFIFLFWFVTLENPVVLGEVDTRHLLLQPTPFFIRFFWVWILTLYIARKTTHEKQIQLRYLPIIWWFWMAQIRLIESPIVECTCIRALIQVPHYLKLCASWQLSVFTTLQLIPSGGILPLSVRWRTWQRSRFVYPLLETTSSIMTPASGKPLKIRWLHIRVAVWKVCLNSCL